MNFTRAAMEARAHAYTRDWVWPEVGRRYRALVEVILSGVKEPERAHSTKAVVPAPRA